MDHLEGVQKNLEKGEAVEEGEGGRKESTWLKAPSKHVWNRDSLSLAMCNTYRPATGVLSNIDHQKKTPNIDQISTTQHFIDQISTAKVPWKARIYNIYF